MNPVYNSPRAADGTGVWLQSARTAAIDQTRGVRIPSGCERVRAPRQTRFRRRPVISVRRAMRWALFYREKRPPVATEGRQSNTISA